MKTLVTLFLLLLLFPFVSEAQTLCNPWAIPSTVQTMTENRPS
jgi:hypothetical protein